MSKKQLTSRCSHHWALWFSSQLQHTSKAAISFSRRTSNETGKELSSFALTIISAKFHGIHGFTVAKSRIHIFCAVRASCPWSLLPIPWPLRSHRTHAPLTSPSDGLAGNIPTLPIIFHPIRATTIL